MLYCFLNLVNWRKFINYHFLSTVLSLKITPPPLRVWSRESVSLIPCLPALGVRMTFPSVQISCIILCDHTAAIFISGQRHLYTGKQFQTVCIFSIQSAPVSCIVFHNCLDFLRALVETLKKKFHIIFKKSNSLFGGRTFSVYGRTFSVYFL